MCKTAAAGDEDDGEFAVCSEDEDEDYPEFADDEEEYADSEAYTAVTDSEEEDDEMPLTPEEHAAMIKRQEEAFQKSLPSATVVTAEELTAEENMMLPATDEQIAAAAEAEGVQELDDGTDLIIDTVSEMPVNFSYEENIVLCDAFSQAEAEDITRQLSGTLLSWTDNTAEIRITESVDALLARMEQAGSNLPLYRKYYISE